MNMEKKSQLSAKKPKYFFQVRALPLHNSCNIILFNSLNTVVS